MRAKKRYVSGSLVSLRARAIQLLFVEQVLPDVEEAGDHDGRAHSDDRGLVNEVHPGAEDGLPAPAALDPVAHLKYVAYVEYYEILISRSTRICTLH